MRVPTGSFARILLSMIAHVTAGPGSWRVFMHPKGRPPSGGWGRKKSEKKRFVCLYRRHRFFSASVPTSRLFYGWNKFFRDCLFLLPHPTHYSLPSLEKKISFKPARRRFFGILIRSHPTPTTTHSLLFLSVVSSFSLWCQLFSDEISLSLRKLLELQNLFCDYELCPLLDPRMLQSFSNLSTCQRSGHGTTSPRAVLRRLGNHLFSIRRHQSRKE